MQSTFSSRCGIATYCRYLCEALDKQEVYCEVLAEHPYPESSFDKDWSSKIPYKFDWSRSQPMIQAIEDSKQYDLLHCQNQFGLFPNMYNNLQLLKECKKPLVVTMHDIVPVEQAKDYMTPWLENSDAIIVHTKTCFDLAKQYDINPEKIHLIPHGTLIVDIPDKTETRFSLNLPINAEIVLSWGFIWESKGILDLVKIFAELRKSHPNAMLIHAGGVHPIIQGSEYLKNILKEAVKLGITPENFQITGWVPENDVKKWFAISDVVVLNYMRGSASASGAGHIAMGSKRPIVKTNDTALEEVPGYTVPRFSPTDLYQGIRKVLEDKDLQKELVEKQDIAAKEMSWKNVAKIHKKLYESL